MLSKFTKSSLVFLVLTATTVGFAVSFKNPLLVYTAVFLVVANLVLYVWAQTTVRGLDIRRQTARLAVATRPTEVTVELTNRRGITRYGTMGFDLHRELTPGKDYTPVAFLTAPPREPVRSAYSFTPVRRGVFRIGPFFLYGGDPFGFYKCWRRVDAFSDLTVLPAPVNFTFTNPASVSQLAQDELETIPSSGESTEFLGVREYMPGESLRRVHWRTTARLGVLISRQYELNVASSISALLLVDETLAQGAGADSPLEYAIRMTAGLGQATTREQFHLSYLAVSGAKHDCYSGIGPQFYQALAVRLARLKGGGAVDFDHANKLIVNYLPSGSYLIAFAGELTSRSRQWFRQLAARFRGLSVVTFNRQSFDQGRAPSTPGPRLSFGEGYLIFELFHSDDLGSALTQILAKSSLLRRAR